MLSQYEAVGVSEIIKPLFREVASGYDFGKYPLPAYVEFSGAFSKLSPSEQDIRNALLWKWGHWGKANFPSAHKNLISEVFGAWGDFVVSHRDEDPLNTFMWWRNFLGRGTTYITVAYITHLVHHKELFPIIDQHNFRAMNNLISCVRNGFCYKKKPSTWQDIADLKQFMQRICDLIPGVSFSDLDRFLMMYGRNYVLR